MDKRPRKKYDWALIRHQYVTALEGLEEVTLDSLCVQYGCSKRQINRISGKEGWPGLRARWRAEAAAQARDDAVETAAQRLNRHGKIMQLIQAKGIKAIQNDDISPGVRDTIEAVKTERVLYGDSEERQKTEPSFMHPDDADAIKTFLLQLKMRRESPDAYKCGLDEEGKEPI